MGVILIDKDTQAFIGQQANVTSNANSNRSLDVLSGLDASTAEPFFKEPSKGIAVQASSSEDVFNLAVSGGGGLFVGVAGAVTVSDINSDTRAYIGKDATINQDTSDANTAQSVNVTAANEVDLRGISGSAAVGLVALSGGVDIGIVKNDTAAYIDDGVQMNARQDVAVQALADKDVDSFAISGSIGGFVGVAGAVAVHAIGSGPILEVESEQGDSNKSVLATDDQRKEEDIPEEERPTHDSVQGFAGAQTQGPELFGALNPNPEADSRHSNDQEIAKRLGDVKTNTESQRQGKVDGKVVAAVDNTASDETSIPNGTSAFIGRGVTVNAGQNIDVLAETHLDFDVKVGTAAVSVFAGLGGAVAVANVSDHAQAFVMDSPDAQTTLSAGNQISIDSGSTETLEGKGFAGGAGLVGVGAQVIVFNENSHQRAFIGDQVEIINADAVSVNAHANQVLDAKAIGVGVGGGAIGVAKAKTTVTGSTEAHIGDGVQIGQVDDQQVNHVTVQADKTLQHLAESRAIAAGIVAGRGSVADANITPENKTGAWIGGNAQIDVAGDVLVESTALTETDAIAKGIGGGLASVGVSDAFVEVSPTIQATIHDNTHIDAGGNVVVNAKQGNPVALLDGAFKLDNVSRGADTIQFDQPPAVDTGDSVIYDNGGGTSIGGLQSGRSYNVIVDGVKKLKLGDEFDAANVDSASDVIRFDNPHGFETGDRIIYERNGNRSLKTLDGKDLQDDQVYYVIAIDANRIKLASTFEEAVAAPLAFNPTQVNSTANELAFGQSHNLVDGQAITYRAPFVALFEAGQELEAQPDGSSTDVEIGDVDSAQNVIDLGTAAQQFTTGQAVTYTTTGNAVQGLNNGETYYIVRLDNNQIQLASTANGAPIELNSAGASGIHSLRPVNHIPIRGLVDGQTYYVVTTVANSFQLAASQEDAIARQNIIDIDASGIEGDHQILLGGIDLDAANTSGIHRLRIDIDPSVAEGDRHRLLGVAVARLDNAKSGDGISEAFAQGSAGSLVGGEISKSRVTFTPNVRTAVGHDSSLGSGGAIAIGSDSNANTRSVVNNFQISFVGVGKSDASTTLTNQSTVKIGDRTSLDAMNTVSLTSDSLNQGVVFSKSQGGGGVPINNAKASATLDHATQTTVGQGAKVNAGQEIQVEAQSNTQSFAQAIADGRGIGTKQSSDATIQIGTEQPQPQTHVEILNGAKFKADRVNLLSEVADLRANAFSKAFGKAAGGKNAANSEVRLAPDNSVTSNTAQVTIREGAIVTGNEQVAIAAHHDNVATSSRAEAILKGPGKRRANANNYQLTTSKIETEAGSKVKTKDLRVEAVTNDTSFNASTRARGLLGKGRTDTALAINRIVDFNSDISPGANPVLEIDADGTVVKACNVEIDDLDGETLGPVLADDIIVKDILNDEEMQAIFRISNLPENHKDQALETNPILNGTQPSISWISGDARFQETFDSVTITNYSDKDLVINDIDVINEAIPRIVVQGATADERSGSFNRNPVDIPCESYQFSPCVLVQFPRFIAPTLITLQNLSETSRPDIRLNGFIDNSHDRIVILNNGGDIVTEQPEALIRTRDLKLVSNQGTIGELVETLEGPVRNRINTQLVQGYVIGEGYELSGDKVRDPDLPVETSLIANAEQAIYLDLQGIQRDGNPLIIHSSLEEFLPTPRFNGPIDSNTDDVDLFIQQSVDGNLQPQTGTYQFDLVEAGSDIMIDAGETDTNIEGNTNLLAASELQAWIEAFQLENPEIQDPDFLPTSHLDVLTGGYITLTEIDDRMEVRRATSAFDSIQLTVQDSAVSGEDLVLNKNAMITAPQGSLTLRVGDDLLAERITLIQAGDGLANPDPLAPPEHTLTILGDYANADEGVGSEIVITGMVNADFLYLFGDRDDDAVSFREIDVDSEIDLGDGQDEIRNSSLGDDYIKGGNGNDILRGDRKREESEFEDIILILDEGGDDRLEGGLGDDHLNGLGGDDLLYGEEGDDELIGGLGNDWLDGGPGNNTLYGGPDADQFVLRNDEGRDVIRDFNLTEGDKVVLAGGLTVEQLSLESDRNDTLIKIGDTLLARVVGIDVETIKENSDNIFI